MTMKFKKLLIIAVSVLLSCFILTAVACDKKEDEDEFAQYKFVKIIVYNNNGTVLDTFQILHEPDENGEYWNEFHKLITDFSGYFTDVKEIENGIIVINDITNTQQIFYNCYIKAL